MQRIDDAIPSIMLVVVIAMLGVLLYFNTFGRDERIIPVAELCAEAVLVTDSIKLCKEDYNCPLTAEQYEDWIIAFTFGKENCTNEREAGTELEEAFRSKETY